ncbi:Fe-S cluster assembly ATPase SufC [Candidatus Peregrinibacteria bacterium]|nr:MAG: Fe-S cluster assembly ATPase SufC [Candidatus Peregrinibacteria bacterium]
MTALKIQSLDVMLEDKPLLQDISLEIPAGSVCVLMGPNGAGKSSLVKTIVGHPNFSVAAGDIQFFGESLLEKTPDERALLGISFVFQSPREIDGLVLKGILYDVYKKHVLHKYGMTLDEARRDKDRRKELSPVKFQKRLTELFEKFSLHPSLLDRDLHKGFSGGEKKKVELIFSLLMKPKFLILDELDSGLDTDALKTCAEMVVFMKEEYNTAVLCITHSTRLISLLGTNEVFVLQDGKIVERGDESLAVKKEKQGF